MLKLSHECPQIFTSFFKLNYSKTNLCYYTKSNIVKPLESGTDDKIIIKTQKNHEETALLYLNWEQ